MRVDLPGVVKESLELIIEDNILKIFGRSSTKLPADTQPVHHEFHMGDFYRSFILSDEVDGEGIGLRTARHAHEVRTDRAFAVVTHGVRGIVTERG